MGLLFGLKADHSVNFAGHLLIQPQTNSDSEVAMLRRQGRAVIDFLQDGPRENAETEKQSTGAWGVVSSVASFVLNHIFFCFFKYNNNNIHVFLCGGGGGRGRLFGRLVFLGKRAGLGRSLFCLRGQVPIWQKLHSGLPLFPPKRDSQRELELQRFGDCAGVKVSCMPGSLQNVHRHHATAIWN